MVKVIAQGVAAAIFIEGIGEAACSVGGIGELLQRCRVQAIILADNPARGGVKGVGYHKVVQGINLVPAELVPDTE